MRNFIVAIQGSNSPFHHLSAKSFFGEDVDILECNSFRDVCKKISNNQVDYGVMAIENKISGGILLNYGLIEEYDLSIIGEVYLPVDLYLLTKHGTKFSDIKEIASNSMSLNQCQYFLSSTDHITITEYSEPINYKELLDSKKYLAFIAGPSIEKEYDLQRISENISDDKNNYTRFYILSKCRDYVDNPDVASVTIEVKNELGSLSDVLVALKRNNINLTKIQSVPILNDNKSYYFHLDLNFKNKTELDTALSEIEEFTISKKVLGLYKKTNFNLSN